MSNRKYDLLTQIYLNWCQQSHEDSNTCIYLLTQIICLHVLFLWIFSICLFIYFNWCQQNQVQAPTCICLFIQMTCWHVLSLWILIFVCLLIIIDVNRSKCKRPPVLCYLCKTVRPPCWHVLSLWILISLCLLMRIDVNTNRSSLFFSDIASRTEQGIDFNVIYW